MNISRINLLYINKKNTMSENKRHNIPIHYNITNNNIAFNGNPLFIFKFNFFDKISQKQASNICKKIIKKHFKKDAIQYLSYIYTKSFKSEGDKVEILKKIVENKSYHPFLTKESVFIDILDTISGRSIDEQNGFINMLQWRDTYNRENGYLLFDAIKQNHDISSQAKLNNFVFKIGKLEKFLKKKKFANASRGQIIGDIMYKKITNPAIKDQFNTNAINNFMETASGEEISLLLQNPSKNKYLLEFFSKYEY